MRFVDEQGDVAPMLQLLEQERVESLQHVQALAVVDRQIELGEDILENLVKGDVGVEDEHRPGALIELVEQLLQQRGLAGTRFTDQGHEPLALGDAVVEDGEPLFVGLRAPQESGVRSQREGGLSQTEERLVHRKAPSIRRDVDGAPDPPSGKT